MTCEPGFHGRYLYIYLNVTEIMVLCEVTIGIGKLYAWYHLTMWFNSPQHVSLTHCIPNYLNVFRVCISFTIDSLTYKNNLEKQDINFHLYSS